MRDADVKGRHIDDEQKGGDREALRDSNVNRGVKELAPFEEEPARVVVGKGGDPSDDIFRGAVGAEAGGAEGGLYVVKPAFDVQKQSGDLAAARLKGADVVCE